MRRLLTTAVLGACVLYAPIALARCGSFTGSTMAVGGVPQAKWRTDYPTSIGSPQTPWSAISFKTEPQKYMASVLDTARPHFRRSGRKLVGSSSEPWWISLWLDYTSSGREPFMGLTKERGPSPGDVSPTNPGGSQVWAVGFYNAPGATVLASVFARPCDPTLPPSVSFPEGTVSVKFLFTDASPNDVAYLHGAPEYDANIDEAGSGSAPRSVKNRSKRTVRLLQVDISVKDRNATATNWVFGTFGWVGPTKGDGLFDNLVPVSLQWGNDPGVYDSNIVQSWVNPSLVGVMYGWPTRMWPGFKGRANGAADNIRSSCLSCHAAARTPRSPKGMLDHTFDMTNDINNAAKVKAHVDTWFRNIKGGTLFDPAAPAVSALDYSLQLEAAVVRICKACDLGALQGPTPGICRAASLFDKPSCDPPPPSIDTNPAAKSKLEAPPPRQ